MRGTMHEKGRLGFRVLTAPPALDLRLLQKFREFPSSTVADAMGRFGFMDPEIRQRTGKPLCGLAVTVQCRPADNLMVHKAIHVAQPGDVIVVRTGGNTANAVFGELMAHAAVASRVGGLVVDGAIRDVDRIAELKFPAYSRSVCPGACDKDGPGEINVPIALDGMVIAPGDLVLGDADGLLCVPYDDVEQVLAASRDKVALEQKTIANIRAGTHDTAWVDARLKALGCEPTPR